jgi:predicted secreted protein
MKVLKIMLVTFVLSTLSFLSLFCEAAQVQTFHQTDDGAPVNIVTGEQFVVNLTGGGFAGIVWHLDSYNNSTINMISLDHFTHGCPDCPIDFVWTFKGAAPGSTALKYHANTNFTLFVTVSPNMTNSTPDAPVLTASSSLSSIDLSWTVPDAHGAPISSYNIYRGTASGNEVVLVSGYKGPTHWSDTAVSTGITYYYKVSAVNLVGEGPRSNEQSARITGTGNGPSTPLGPSVSPGNAQVILTWHPSTTGTAPSQYNIYRSSSRTGTYVLVGSTSGTQYRDAKLSNGHTYWYKINAQNTNGFSKNTTAVRAVLYTTAIGPDYNYLIILAVIIVVTADIVFRWRTAQNG